MNIWFYEKLNQVKYENDDVLFIFIYSKVYFITEIMIHSSVIIVFSIEITFLLLSAATTKMHEGTMNYLSFLSFW